MILAFCYDTYYCWGLQQNFRGVFDDIDEAKDSIVGGRSENQNLELINSETLEFQRYEWIPLYEIEYVIPEGIEYRDFLKLSNMEQETRQKAVLTHRYDKTVVETTTWELNNRNGKYYHLYQAGRWE